MTKHPISIQKCPLGHVSKLQSFLKEHWGKDHILANHIDFLMWQHAEISSPDLNYYIAIEGNNTIEGTLGFIPLHKYDKDLTGNDSLWITTWKVNPNNQTIGLGFLILNTLMKAENPNWIGSLGLNPKTLPFYKKLKFQTGILNHYFILNPNISNYELYSGPSTNDKKTRSLHQLKEINTISNLKEKDFKINSDLFPLKSLTYFKNRYENHPILDYLFYTLEVDNSQNLYVFRIDSALGAKALRLIDFYGSLDTLATETSSLSDLLKKVKAEYLDLYIHTSVDLNFERSAWVNRHLSDVIIPNYFSPFEKKNIDIHFAYKGASACFFKGDSDQDRPN